MKSVEYLKAALVGLLALALNLLLSVPVILFWQFVVVPGRSEAYYKDLPMQVAPWSSLIGGTLIFLALAYVFARRRPQRNALAFAAVAWAAYLIVDLALSLPYGISSMMTPAVATDMAAKLAAALAGAWLATRKK